MNLDSLSVHGAPFPVLAQPNRGTLINLVLGLWEEEQPEPLVIEI